MFQYNDTNQLNVQIYKPQTHVDEESEFKQILCLKLCGIFVYVNPISKCNHFVHLQIQNNQYDSTYDRQHG